MKTNIATRSMPAAIEEPRYTDVIAGTKARLITVASIFRLKLRFILSVTEIHDK